MKNFPTPELENKIQRHEDLIPDFYDVKTSLNLTAKSEVTTDRSDSQKQSKYELRLGARKSQRLTTDRPGPSWEDPAQRPIYSASCTNKGDQDNRHATCQIAVTWYEAGFMRTINKQEIFTYSS
jgi:hypothetical protein